MAIRYEELRPLLKTGDIVLFQGKGLFSQVIRTFTRSGGKRGKYTHVGMVIDPSEISSRLLTKAKRDALAGDRVLLLAESTTMSTVRDVETGKFTSGVQTALLSQRLATYKGKVWVRRLNKRLTKPKLDAMMALRRELSGRAYERSPWALFRAAIDWPFSKQRRDLRSLFCSEYDAAMYMAAELLKEPPSASEITPINFGNYWELEDGYSLGSAIRLDLEVAG